MSECLAGHGYRLPPGRTFDARGDLSQYGIKPGTHTAVRSTRFVVNGVEVRSAVPARDYRPSKAEAAFAVAFVRCAGLTGLFAELDRSELRIQREIVERHVSEFHGLNPRIKALAQRADAVLRER